MHSGKAVFAQLMDWIHPEQFRRCVARYSGNYKVRDFSCWDQFLAMSFAQITFRESLADIEICLRSRQEQLYHMGFRSSVAHSTLADANSARNWRIYADLAQGLIRRARKLYVHEPLGLELDQTVYALDSRPVDRSCGLRSDHIVWLHNPKSATHYPDRLRRVSYRDPEDGRVLVFLTNNFDLPALAIAHLYKLRWRVELFFKWIKQNLRIKHFFGTSDNAVKTQVWIAVCVYVLIAILRKELGLELSLSQMLQVLSVNVFEQVPLVELFAKTQSQDELLDSPNQLMLWS